VDELSLKHSIPTVRCSRGVAKRFTRILIFAASKETLWPITARRK
jgi:hypothetical protein